MGMDVLSMSPAALAEMISLIDEGIISGKIAKDVLPRLLEGQGNEGVRVFVQKEGLVQISGRCCCLGLCLPASDCQHVGSLQWCSILVVSTARPTSCQAELIAAPGLLSPEYQYSTV